MPAVCRASDRTTGHRAPLGLRQASLTRTRYAPDMIERAAARGYTAAGADYERARPSYPTVAVDLLVTELGIQSGRTVVDLAAGTGKLTRLLQPTGALVIAVEPVTAMLERLVTAVPQAHPVAGTAEAIPLAEASADAVVVGTAFHWFRGEHALREIDRVLRPGSGLGLIWNNPDRTVDWMDQVWSIVDDYRGDAPRNRDLRWQAAFTRTAAFTPLRHRRFAHDQEVARDELLTRVASTSFVAALPAADRERALSRVREVMSTHPDLAGRERFRLPYRTDVYCCRTREGRS